MSHRQRFLRRTVSERLADLSTPEPNSGCLLWIGAYNKHGYGKLTVDGKTLGAHRVAYEIEKGAVQKGMVLDHKCRVRCCINPEHLEAVSNRENILRGQGWSGQNSRKTHCPSGHPYEGANLAVWKNGTMTARHCRTCAREKNRRLYETRKARTMRCDAT